MEAADFYAREEAQLHPELVTYVVELDGQVIVVENVPARVNQVTGEQLFSSETLERLFQIVRGQASTPMRLMETPVYSFAA